MMNFRDPLTDLKVPPSIFPALSMPSRASAQSPHNWAAFLFRSINFFYKCGAVHDVVIGGRGKLFYNWEIELNMGNDPAWMEPFLKGLLLGIRDAKEKAGYGAPESLLVKSPGMKDVIFHINTK